MGRANKEYTRLGSYSCLLEVFEPSVCEDMIIKHSFNLIESNGINKTLKIDKCTYRLCKKLTLSSINLSVYLQMR